MFMMILFVLLFFFFFSSRRRHTRCLSDWSSDVCSSDLSGRLYNEAAGKVHFWLTFIGMNLTFMPMHVMGILGMPRRIYTYRPQYTSLNEMATVGAFILLVAMSIFVINMLMSLWKGRRAPADPWGHEDFNRTLEWTVSSPPPPENFGTIPVIR